MSSQTKESLEVSLHITHNFIMYLYLPAGITCIYIPKHRLMSTRVMFCTRTYIHFTNISVNMNVPSKSQNRDCSLRNQNSTILVLYSTVLNAGLKTLVGSYTISTFFGIKNWNLLTIPERMRWVYSKNTTSVSKSETPILATKYVRGREINRRDSKVYTESNWQRKLKVLCKSIRSWCICLYLQCRN